MILFTDRLVLREFEESDLPVIREFDSDPEVFRYQRYGPNTQEQSREWLNRAIARKQEQPRLHFHFAIVLRRENHLIGHCRISISDVENRQGFIGYDLNRDYWNQGYATEATQRVIDFGFKVLGLHRIFANCSSENRASTRVLEKCGMRLEAYLREHRFVKCKWRNDLTYAVLEGEWKV
jgi:RimJ/RimL family protein N-acetyltransferase